MVLTTILNGEKFEAESQKNYYAMAFMTSSGVIRLVVNGLAELQFTTNY